MYYSGDFIPSIEKLPPEFNGHDPEAVIQTLEEAAPNLPKSMFETSAEYEARRASAAPGPHRLIFVLNADQLAPVLSVPRISYDADTQTVTASVWTPKTTFYVHANSPEFTTLSLKSIVRSSDKYIGSNGFGARAVVRDLYIEEFGVAFSWALTFLGGVETVYGGRETKISFNMDRSQAQDCVPHLRIALICSLAEPIVYKDVTGHEPTFANPSDTTTSRRFIVVLPKQVWLFDSRTGKVHFKAAGYEDDSSGMPGGTPDGAIGGIISKVPGAAPPSPVEPAAPVAPQQIRVDSKAQEAKLTNKVSQAYPPLARSSRISGVVRFNAIIGTDGRIQNLQLVTGHPLLVPSAQAAVSQWVYRPTLLNGNPVEVMTQIEVNFTLQP